MFYIGLDEVGTGALAGPAYVCAAVCTRQWEIPEELTDSKKMSWNRKARVYELLVRDLTDFRIASVPNTRIDEVGLRQAWLEAVGCALHPLVEKYPNCDITVDGQEKHPDFKMSAVPKADRDVPIVSAASVIAKVNRDMFMIGLHEKYPHYDWKTNMGYGSKNHWAGIYRHGLSPYHRLTYGKIKGLAKQKFFREGSTR